MTHVLLTVLDLGGTFVFAISGAAAAVKHRLDIFGVMVLAFAAGNAGGITRDLAMNGGLASHTTAIRIINPKPSPSMIWLNEIWVACWV
ncbi:MAG TPA: TRIC cation channel family protein, partial [Rhodanobacteraceae bacterium]|nr:TRIC cation channel family protein [Rhodanobacteraceae bacterium]